MKLLESLRVLLCGKKDTTALELKLSDLEKKNAMLDEHLNDLRKSLVQANFSLEEKQVKIMSLSVQVMNLMSELEELEKPDKHESLFTFLTWLEENLEEKNIIVNTSDGGVFPHDYLKITDRDLIEEFAEELITTNESFANEDDLVYTFCVRFYKKYPVSKFYKSDSEVFGKAEVFSTPEETIALLRDEGTYADCDNARGLMYACLKVLLDAYFPDWNPLRLLAFDVNVWMGAKGGHALLAWVKEGINDFIPVESTYYPEKFRDMWNKGYRMRDNTIAYEIRYSFDDKTEYKLKQ